MSPRDRRILRRGLLAGGGVGAVFGALLGIGLAGAGGRASAAGVLLGLAVGAMVCSGWLLLALGLDLVAREQPGRGRLLWTALLTALALFLPLLAFAAGATGGPPSPG